MRATVDPIWQPVRSKPCWAGIFCGGGDGCGRGLARALDLLGEKFLALEPRFTQGADICCRCSSPPRQDV